MNTTIKFTCLNGDGNPKPVIKIVQHESVFENDLISISEQVNPVDILAREFLTPEWQARSTLFKEERHLLIPADNNPTHRITILEPISESDVAKKLRWELLKRYIPFNMLYDFENPKETNHNENPSIELGYYISVFKKFNEFFDYVDGLTKPENRVLFGEVSCKHTIPLETIRDYFEFQLTSEYRLKAFKNADKSTLDQPAKNLFDAIVKSTHNDVGSTPEGSDFWINAINECGCSI